MLWDYTVTTDTIWTNFDSGRVIAKNRVEAHKKAFNKILNELNKVNKVLSENPITDGTEIHIDIQHLRLTLVKEELKFSISRSSFLKWYFESGQDSENESLFEELKTTMLNSLFDKGDFTITVEELFKNCNKEAIKLCYLREFSSEDEGELSELGLVYKVALID